MKIFKCVVKKPIKCKELKELKKCAEVKVIKCLPKCPPKYNDCFKPVKCYDSYPS